MDTRVGYEQLRSQNTNFLMSAIAKEIERASSRRRQVLEADFTKLAVLDVLGDMLPVDDPYALKLERRREDLLYRHDKQRYIEEMSAAVEVIAPYSI